MLYFPQALPLFPDLRVLILGSGSGGTSDVLLDKFRHGVFVMERLVVFSLTYDCDDEILKLLRKNCANSLKVLNVEHSSRVRKYPVV